MTTVQPEFAISVTFRHTESTDTLKQYALDKLNNVLSKYLKTPADVHIVLSVEKRDHIAEAVVRSKDYDVSAKAVTDNLYAAIDKVVDTVDTQLRKQKGRLVDQKYASCKQIDS